MALQIAATLKLHEHGVSELTAMRVAGAIPPSSMLTDGQLGSVELDRGASRSVVWREALQRRVLAAGDVGATAVAVLVVLGWFDQPHAALAALTGGCVTLGLFKIAGLYDHDDLRLMHSTLDEAPALAQITGLMSLGVAVLSAIALSGTLGAEHIATLWLVSFGAIFTGRMLARAIAVRMSPVERCLVIGEPTLVDRVREKLAASRAHAVVIASLPLAGEDFDDGDWTAMPLLIRRVVGDLNVHRIIIAPATTDTTAVVNLIRTAKAVGVRVSVLPRMFEVVGSAVEFDDVDGMTMLGVRRFGLSRSSWVLKRAFDFVVAGIGLVVVSPVLVLIAVAIRIDSRGPTFFRQVRVGRDGRHFRIYKFRSMIAGADALREDLRALSEAGPGLFKIADDPRVTRVGRFLRRTSLDELAQLMNVVRGEMSLVGPRPLVVDEDAQVLGLDRSRLHLTPGMTGPWQIMGSRVPMHEMVGIDYLYVANWSLWLDLKVLIRTARHVARRGNV